MAVSLFVYPICCHSISPTLWSKDLKCYQLLEETVLLTIGLGTNPMCIAKYHRNNFIVFFVSRVCSALGLWVIQLLDPYHLGSVGHGLLVIWPSGYTSLWLATPTSSEPSLLHHILQPGLLWVINFVSVLFYYPTTGSLAWLKKMAGAGSNSQTIGRAPKIPQKKRMKDCRSAKNEEHCPQSTKKGS